MLKKLRPYQSSALLKLFGIFFSVLLLHPTHTLQAEELSNERANDVKKETSAADLPDMSFLNKSGTTDMMQEMIAAFPPGTSRHSVEAALIGKAGAEYSGKRPFTETYPEERNAHQYKYRKPLYLRFLHDGRYTITIFYDENDKVKEKITRQDGKSRPSILISGPTGL